MGLSSSFSPQAAGHNSHILRRVMGGLASDPPRRATGSQAIASPPPLLPPLLLALALLLFCSPPPYSDAASHTVKASCQKVLKAQDDRRLPFEAHSGRQLLSLRKVPPEPTNPMNGTGRDTPPDSVNGTGTERPLKGEPGDRGDPGCPPPGSCDFYFDGTRKGSIFTLSRSNNYVSPPIRHVKGMTLFAKMYINPGDGAPCRTTGQTSSCSYFNVRGPSSPSRLLGDLPRINLARRDSSGLNAVKNNCYSMYFKDFLVAVGVGPGGRQFVPWSDPNKYFPKKKRCIIFQVA